MDQEEGYVKRILKVMIYIEENIDEDLTLERLSKIACYSPFHFHRIFQAIVGETIHGYVKRLRMQTAEGKLRYTDFQERVFQRQRRRFKIPLPFLRIAGYNSSNMRSKYEKIAILYLHI